MKNNIHLKGFDEYLEDNIKDAVKLFKFTKESTHAFIEESLFRVRDYSARYYAIQSIDCDIIEAAEMIYNYLQSQK